MAILLRVPTEQLDPPAHLELRLRHVQAWLASLPMSRPVAAGEEALLNLRLLNESKVPSATRLPLAEAYRPVVEVLLDELEAQATQAGFPQPDSAAQALRVHQALAEELGCAYKLLITELASRLVSFGLRRQLPGLAYRALAAEARVLRAAWLNHAAVPIGTWQEIHHLYAIAERAEVTTTILEAGQSIQDAYLECLLEALADPYQLPHRDLGMIPTLLQRHRGAAALLRQMPATPGPTHFQVDLSQDRRPLHHPLAGPSGSDTRVLDTSALLTRLRAHYRALMAGQSPPGVSGHDLRQQASLLERVIVSWGEQPGRYDDRQPAELTSAVRVGLDEIRASLGATPPLASPGWRVADQSASGLRLTYTGRALPRPVTVGEVLAVRLGPEGGKPVGVVRWIRGSGASTWDCGLQLLAPSASPVSLLSVNARGEPTQVGALLLERESAMAPPTLLAARGTHADSREYALCHPGETLRVRAGPLLEQNRVMELFEASPA